jgi:hypothetical protein
MMPADVRRFLERCDSDTAREMMRLIEDKYYEVYADGGWEATVGLDASFKECLAEAKMFNNGAFSGLVRSDPF